MSTISLLCLVCIIHILLHRIAPTIGNDVASMAQTILRTNYGVYFDKDRTLVNGASYYKHTYAIQWPNVTFDPYNKIQCVTAMEKEGGCEWLNKLIGATNTRVGSIYSRLQTRLRNIKLLMPKVNLEANKGKRRYRRDTKYGEDACDNIKQPVPDSGGLLSTVGKAISDITGQPTYDDIHAIGAHICELGDIAKQTANEIKASFKRLSSFESHFDNRYDTAQKEIKNLFKYGSDIQAEFTKTTLLQVENLQNITQHLYVQQRAMNVTLQISANLQLLESEVDKLVAYTETFFDGIDKLNQGYMSPNLVLPTSIRRLLDHIRNVVIPVSKANLIIAHPNPYFYYNIKKIAFIADDSYMYVTVNVPMYTSGSLMAVYLVQSYQFALADNVNSSTKIVGLPDFIAISADQEWYVEISAAEYTACKGEDLRICPTEKSFQSMSVPTCASALYQDSKEHIKRLCDVRYTENLLHGFALRLGAGRYLVSAQHTNEKWNLACPKTGIREVKSCTTCIIEIPCFCSLVGSFKIESIQNCDVSDDSDFNQPTYFHPVNLHLLLHLYDPDSLVHINGTTNSIDSKWNISLPIFDIVAYNISQVAESFDENQISFDKLMKATLAGGAAYATSVDAAIKQQEDYSDLKAAHTKGIAKLFGGSFGGSFYNANNIVGGMSGSMILSVVSLFIVIMSFCMRRKSKG